LEGEGKFEAKKIRRKSLRRIVNHYNINRLIIDLDRNKITSKVNCYLRTQNPENIILPKVNYKIAIIEIGIVVK